jgi:hypothetical protein
MPSRSLSELRELRERLWVISAINLCEADSAAISLVKEGGTDAEYFPQWAS